ncbi:hypothetical protein V7O66_11680 [Methanolobus sp. ZRKC3]|uniref:DUF7289 family protein n=1 Tax=Methanolobus sp. ZRKC3 TaxID=3125786 RepID=UPI00324AA0F7
MKREITSSDEAVSEMVDFAILLSIMVLAITIVSVAGVPMMQHMQDVQHTENIRQSFKVLAPNVNKIIQGTAPSQSVELKMYGGSLSVTGESDINVTMQVWNASATPPAFEANSFESQTSMIENHYLENSICYENTGVWAKYDTGRAVMVSQPSFTFVNDVLVIPDVNIFGAASTSGSGLVRVTAEGGKRAVRNYENVSQVNITLKSSYYQAWERYLNENLKMTISTVDHANNTIYASRDYSGNIDVFIISSPMTVTIE